MKKSKYLCPALLMALCFGPSARAQDAVVYGPDSLLRVDIAVKEGRPVYAVAYKGKTILEDSPLGFVTDVGDFTTGLSFAGTRQRAIDETYHLDRIKQSEVHYRANELSVTLRDREGRTFDVVFRVSDNDLAFRYELPRYGDTGCVVSRP